MRREERLKKDQEASLARALGQGSINGAVQRGAVRCGAFGFRHATARLLCVS
jgi:hypothetical protein